MSAAKGAEIVKRSDTRNEEIRTALDGRKCWKALYFPSDGTLWNCGVVGAILGADEGLESVPDGGFGARLEVARCTHRLAMGEMAASIAHEINQPLAAIASNGYAGLRWLANPTPKLDEARDALERIVNDSQRAKEVVAGIRSMFKREGQAKAPQDVNKLIREVLTLVRSDAENQRVSVRTELFDELPQVPAGPVQLAQVVVNLIMNAIDAMSTVVNRPRVLQVKTEVHESGYLLITVEDAGMGIDPENLSRIFDPFFTTKPHGMGMGLSICRSIIENQDRRLSVSAGQPYGSIFYVFLPIDPSGPK